MPQSILCETQIWKEWNENKQDLLRFGEIWIVRFCDFEVVHLLIELSYEKIKSFPVTRYF